MVLSPVEDFPTAKITTLDELPKDGHWAVMTRSRRDEAALLHLQNIMKDRLIVSEVWKELLPQASIMISSAISGGSLKERFEEAVKGRSCWLLPEPMKATFPLPFPDGIELPNVYIPEHGFYSEFLCCYYMHYFGIARTHVVLWDTEETMTQKIQLAKALGFHGLVDPS